MNIRQALSADAPVLAQIEKTQPQAAAWGVDGFVGELLQKNAFIWCAQEEQNLIGFLALRAVAESAEILNVAVRPDWTRRGVGKALLLHALAELKKQGIKQVTLEVAQDNLPANALYKQAGMKALNVRKDFYGQGRHGWILGKEL